MPQNCEVFRPVAHANTALIFTKGDIKHPMNRIFDPPVRTYGISEQLRITGKTQNIITRFDSRFAGKRPLAFNHSNSV